MPVERFWLLLNSITRIAAEEQLEGMSVARVASAEEKDYKAYSQKLKLTLGDIVKYDEPWEQISEAEAAKGWSRLRQWADSGKNKGYSRKRVSKTRK